MKPNIRQGLKICFTIVGTNIGAGFASGRELWEFFASYGPASSLYIVLSMALFAVCSMVILWISWKERTDHYHGILKHLMGTKMTSFFDGLILLYLMASTLVMFAGSGATFAQWNVPFTVGVVVLAVAVWLIMFRGVDGLMSLNYLLMPALTVILLSVCLFFLLHSEPQTMAVNSKTHWQPVWPSAIIYASFNVIPLMAVLSTLGRRINHPLEIGIAGICSAVCLSGVAILFNMSLLRIEHLIAQYDIPLFALIDSYSSVWLAIISFILWLAIYTTAVSGMYGAVFRISDWLTLPRWLIALLFIALMIPLTQLGFATLVQVIYPLYGVINLFVLAMILLYPLSRTR